MFTDIHIMSRFSTRRGCDDAGFAENSTQVVSGQQPPEASLLTCQDDQMDTAHGIPVRYSSTPEIQTMSCESIDCPDSNSSAPDAPFRSRTLTTLS